MAQHTRPNTQRKSVRNAVKKSGGRESHIDKPTRATGRRALREAARQEGHSGNSTNISQESGQHRKKSVRRVTQGPAAGKAKKSRRA